jgi:atypical dual specificity phosphatase
MTAEIVLSVRHWGIAFGARQVLRDVSFSVPSPGCTVLLGPSGTGKSTLLRTLAGYNRFHAEMVCQGEADYVGAPCADGNRPALVMQNSRLLVSNVMENLVCDLPNRSSLTRRMQLEALEPLLAECGQSSLLQILDAKVVERPIEEQRIIAILRQAVAGPKLLMVDEPTTGLSAAQAERALLLIERLAQTRALLVVLHHLQQARRLARHVLLLADGKVQEDQPSPEFFEQTQSAAARLFLATGSCPEGETGQSPEAEIVAPSEEPARPARDTVASAASGPRGFVWLMPGQLAGTPWPGIVHGAEYDLQALRNVGVTHLVSLTEDPFNPAIASPHGISCTACPMPDMQPPSHAQALELCQRIDQLLAAGEVVAVHCRAGLGRTGTVLAAYWLWLGRGRVGALQALEDVRRREPGWVQSASQVKFLEEFALVVANQARDAANLDPAAEIDGMAAVS